MTPQAAPAAALRADRAACAACVAETLDPFARRYRYAFTACPQCGPARPATVHRPCADCRHEADDPAGRRFRWQGIACHACGPRLRLLRVDGRAFAADAYSFLDDTDAATTLLGRGEVVLVKGPGGYQLACDATQAAAVQRLRTLLPGGMRPLALLVKDLDMLRRWCVTTPVAEQALTDPAAPQVLLARRSNPFAGAVPLADTVAPGLHALGVMLPPTPLHHLLMRRRRAPLVLASVCGQGGAPEVERDTAIARLGAGLDWVLDHELPVAAGVHDALGQVVDGQFRVLRRGRGLLPALPPWPPGFGSPPPLDTATVGHHHAQLAACLGEHGWPLQGGPVLGIVLGDPAMGDDGTLWGGEFLQADYQRVTRLGCLKPVALPGGERAVHEPWRHTHAQLMAEMGWARFEQNFRQLDLYRFLAAQPRAELDRLLADPLLAPRCGSAARLFDAVAAAIGLCRERQAHAGEALLRLQDCIAEADLDESPELDYPFATPRLDRGRGLPYIEPLAMWQALLGDLILDTPPSLMAARFHRGLARVIVSLAVQLAQARGLRTVALGGGVFQNRVLTERVLQGLRDHGLQPLLPSLWPADDAQALAWGRWLVALARRPS